MKLIYNILLFFSYVHTTILYYVRKIKLFKLFKFKNLSILKEIISMKLAMNSKNNDEISCIDKNSKLIKNILHHM